MTPVDPPAPLPQPPGTRALRRVLAEVVATEGEWLALHREFERVLAAHDGESHVRALDAREELPWNELRFLAIDTETTGLHREHDRIIEVAWVVFDRGVECTSVSHLLSSDVPLPAGISRLTGISAGMLAQQPDFAEVAPQLIAAMRSVDFVVAYHAPFDQGFLHHALARAGLPLPSMDWVDPLVFVKELDRFKPGKKLSDATERWGVPTGRAHRALDDARAAGLLLLRMAPYLPVGNLVSLVEHQLEFSRRQRDESAGRATRRAPRTGEHAAPTGAEGLPTPVSDAPAPELSATGLPADQREGASSDAPPDRAHNPSAETHRA